MWYGLVWLRSWSWRVFVSLFHFSFRSESDCDLFCFRVGLIFVVVCFWLDVSWFDLESCIGLFWVRMGWVAIVWFCWGWVRLLLLCSCVEFVCYVSRFRRQRGRPLLIRQIGRENRKCSSASRWTKASGLVSRVTVSAVFGLLVVENHKYKKRLITFTPKIVSVCLFLFYIPGFPRQRGRPLLRRQGGKANRQLSST